MALTTTSLSAAVSAAKDQWISVASATGFTASTTGCFCQGEFMEVLEVSGTNIKVLRGASGTLASKHNSGSVVYVAPLAYFHFSDPQGQGATTDDPGYPWINVNNGKIWTVLSSKWVETPIEPQVVSFTLTSATPGTIRAVTGEITLPAAVTSGNPVGVRGSVTIPTAGTVSGAYLYGAQGKVITGTGTFSGTALAGVYGQLDVTGGTISGGNVAAVQANIYGATSGSIPIEGVYVEHAGGGVINSLIKLFGKSDYVLDIASNTHTQMGTTGGATTAAGWLKVKVEGVVRYINLFSTAP